jgi:phosphoglycolate phosphatase
MNRALIFDLDGTLVDSLPGITHSLNLALTGLNLPTHSPEAVRGFIGNGSRVLVTRAAPEGSEIERIDSLENAFKIDYDVSWPAGTFPYPGIVELLENLQALKIPLAVLSNKPHPFTDAIVARLFPEIRFSAVIGQRDGIPHKPNPTGALEIAATFGLEPENCLLIGDSTIDLETGRNAGMRTVAVNWGYHDVAALISANPNHLVAAPEAILDLVV